MRLLIITQRVDIDDDNLGFFHRWLEKFSERLEEIYVICLAKGKYNLPDNVHVFSMGKERGASKAVQFILLQKHLLGILPKVDGVFVHMAPVYAIASFPLASVYDKKIILWFVHKSVNWKLKLASKLVDKILTASEESCRLINRKKIKIIGHGVDTALFRPDYNLGVLNGKFRILSAGRISPVKDQETLINATDILVNQNNAREIEVKIIGTPLENYEKKYFERLRRLVVERGLEDYVKFLGSISYEEMPKYYHDSDIFINLSHTGSMDKVVLEAMASALPVLTCNEAFRNILDSKYLFNKKDPLNLAEKIIALRGAERDASLRELVLKRYDLDNLMVKIIEEFDDKK